MFRKINHTSYPIYSFLLLCFFMSVTFGLSSCGIVLNSRNMPEVVHSDVNTAVNTFAQALISEYTPSNAQDLKISIDPNSLFYRIDNSPSRRDVVGKATIEWSKHSFWSTKYMKVDVKFKIDYEKIKTTLDNKEAYAVFYVLDGNRNFRNIASSDWMTLVSGTSMYILSEYLNQ